MSTEHALCPRTVQIEWPSPSPPREERAGERRPSSLPVHADSHVHGARFAPQNRPGGVAFSLSSAGGEGPGEEAVPLAGSWGGGRHIYRPL